MDFQINVGVCWLCFEVQDLNDALPNYRWYLVKLVVSLLSWLVIVESISGLSIGSGISIGMMKIPLEESKITNRNNKKTKKIPDIFRIESFQVIYQIMNMNNIVADYISSFM